MQRGEFEPDETLAVQGLLQESDVLINVGANIGYYCCIALQKGKRVIAFEPMPSNLRCFTRNMQLNNWSHHVELYPIALGREAGLIEIYGGGTGASLVPGWANQDRKQSLCIPCSTLDNVLHARMRGLQSLILMDVEGAELGVLQGATELLQNSPKPIWLIEISVNEHQPAGISVNPNLVATFERLLANGYEATTVGADSRCVAMAEILQIAQTGTDTLKTHNFVFRPL